MFRKLLVALDCSHQAEHVLSEAIDLAKAINSEVMLLHVLTSEEQGAPEIAVVSSGMDYLYANTDILFSYRENWRQYGKDCMERLKQHAAYANSKGVEVEWSQQVGSPPGKTICDFARAWQADLIVIGRHGRRGLSELFVGSVSNYVVHHATCTVLVADLTSQTIDQPEAEKALAS